MVNSNTPRDIVMTDDASGSGAIQFGSSAVREWDRAVGLCLKDENAVVLAAHRLDMFPGLNDTLVCAVTGQPESALKVKQALAGKIKELEEEGRPGLTVEKAAEFVPKLSKQFRNVEDLEFFVVGRDWDQSRGAYVPCLSLANKMASRNLDPRNPETCYSIGKGAICTQIIVDSLFEEDMSRGAAVDVALRAIYCAAFSQNVKGQAVESIDVCVVTAESITTERHFIKDLHAKYGPILEARMAKLRGAPPPTRYTV